VVLSVLDAEPRMLGPQKVRRLDEPIRVSLDDLVPASHFYRLLERALDLAFVRELVRETYAETGRPSLDPVVFFKLHLILFFEGLRSERELLRVVDDRLSLRWYLGYALDEALPDHSSLTRLRERYGLEVVRRFFEAIVEQCIAAGLVWGQELYLDSTDVEANAALSSLRPRFAVEAHLARLFAHAQAPEDEAPADGDDGDTPRGDADEPTALPVVLTEEARSALAERADGRRDWLGALGRMPRTRPPGAVRRTADYRASTTDLDATPLRPKGANARLGYHDHYVGDGGKARIILTAWVTPAEVADNQPALDLLWRTRFRWKLHPRQVTGDSKYGTVENIVALEEQGLRAYMPVSAAGRSPGLFQDTEFVYDPETDTYRCPAEQTLRFRHVEAATQRRLYAAEAAVCRACPLRSRCTTSARGRQIGRGPHEAYVDRVRSYHTTAAYAKARRKRSLWLEPLFAEAKQWHGLRRFRLRTLERVNSEAHLIAAGQNLKRLLSHRGWGRRPFPGGAPGLALPTIGAPPPP
jgi:transposase